jgi:hypothetical protein
MKMERKKEKKMERKKEKKNDCVYVSEYKVSNLFSVY